MVEKSTRLQVTPQQSTQDTANLPLQTYEKTGELFLLSNTGVDINFRNNFANSDSFAKVSVPVHIYNSLLEVIHFILYKSFVDAAHQCHRQRVH